MSVFSFLSFLFSFFKFSTSFWRSLICLFIHARDNDGLTPHQMTKTYIRIPVAPSLLYFRSFAYIYVVAFSRQVEQWTGTSLKVEQIWWLLSQMALVQLYSSKNCVQVIGFRKLQTFKRPKIRFYFSFKAIFTTVGGIHIDSKIDFVVYFNYRQYYQFKNKCFRIEIGTLPIT